MDASIFQDREARMGERSPIYDKIPSTFIDRHEQLQILINLLSNARHALVASESQEKRLSIRVRTAPEVQQGFTLELPLAGEEVRS